MLTRQTSTLVDCEGIDTRLDTRMRAAMLRIFLPAGCGEAQAAARLPCGCTAGWGCAPHTCDLGACLRPPAPPPPGGQRAAHGSASLGAELMPSCELRCPLAHGGVLHWRGSRCRLFACRPLGPAPTAVDADDGRGPSPSLPLREPLACVPCSARPGPGRVLDTYENESNGRQFGYAISDRLGFGRDGTRYRASSVSLICGKRYQYIPIGHIR